MSAIGNVYGQALYSLAREERVSEGVLAQITALDASFAREPDFLRLLSSHNLSKEERCGVLDRCFRGSVHPYVLNFLKILTRKGYIRRFSECAAFYRAQYNEDEGILQVKAVTAIPMSEEQCAKLSEKLGRITGKTIELTNRVDKSCLGGVRLDYDGKRVDGTVAYRLDALRSLLKNGHL